MIINVSQSNFNGVMRNGDMIAVANIVEYLRKTTPEVKIHFTPGTINNADYCQKFYQFLLENTDYFSDTPGDKMLSWQKANIWDFRDVSGDLVKIRNEKDIEDKIVIFPVFDAPYNVYRNWPKEVFNKIIEEYNSDRYKDYQKIICISPNLNIGNIDGWEISTDFMTNINHIMTCATYVGGDTGTSHFAWALDRSPPNLIYYSSSRELLHTLPFYALKGKGQIRTYWLDFEGTKWV